MPRETLEKQVWTRLTTDDFDRVEKVATEMGLSTSAFVRQAVIDALDEIGMNTLVESFAGPVIASGKPCPPLESDIV